MKMVGEKVGKMGRLGEKEVFWLIGGVSVGVYFGGKARNECE